MESCAVPPETLQSVSDAQGHLRTFYPRREDERSVASDFFAKQYDQAAEREFRELTDWATSLLQKTGGFAGDFRLNSLPGSDWLLLAAVLQSCGAGKVPVQVAAEDAPPAWRAAVREANLQCCLERIKEKFPNCSAQLDTLHLSAEKVLHADLMDLLRVLMEWHHVSHNTRASSPYVARKLDSPSSHARCSLPPGELATEIRKRSLNAKQFQTPLPRSPSVSRQDGSFMSPNRLPRSPSVSRQHGSFMSPHRRRSAVPC